MQSLIFKKIRLEYRAKFEGDGNAELKRYEISTRTGYEKKFEVRSGSVITKTRLCNIQQYFSTVKMFIFRRFFRNIFLIFAQNIDFGYTLEPPH